MGTHPAMREPASNRRTSVLEDAVQLIAGELLSSFQELELDEKYQGVNHAAERLHEIAGRLRRPAGRQQVVHDQHSLPGCHRIVVDLEGVGPVLECVAGALGRGWQLTG